MKEQFIELIKYLFFKNSVLILLLFLSVCLHITISVFKIVTTSAPDFPSYYFATADFVTGINAYTDNTIQNIYIYPAVSSLLYLPFLMFPYEISQGVFVILSTLTVPSIVYLSLKLIYKKFSWRHFVVFTAFTFLSFPTKFTLGMGQVNLLAFFLLLIGYYFYQKRDDTKSGMLLALAFLAKPILSFVLLFFLIKKAWRVFATIVVTLAILLFFSLLLYGMQMEIYYLQYVVPMLLEGNTGREVYYNQGLLGVLSRTFEDVTLRKNFATVFGAVMLLGTYFVVRKKKPNDNLILALLLTLLPLIHSLSWQHYFVFLIFPFILVTKTIWENKKYVQLGILGTAYILVSANIKDPSMFFSFPVNLLQSHTFFGGILLLFLLLYTELRKHIVNFNIVLIIFFLTN